ncbi:hypothetical protein C826_00636 [Helicobacter bilis WiWa]|uniref:Uncharacterized protein n=2 Tax=Helicobacter bilis TaxID=37372 RepID=N2BGA2_9HELI|nr:hypothetical protein C826_00636 [Helicobacter bilis WiWa]
MKVPLKTLGIKMEPMQTFINDANKDIAPIFENHMKEYERCGKKMFESGRKKCKAKVNAKTLKMLEAKLN